MGTPPVEMQCYDLGGFKELLKLDTSLTSVETIAELQSQKLNEMDQIIQNQQQELTLRANSTLILQTENTRLFNAWKEENQRRLELENRPSMSWLPWALAGIGVAMAAGFGAVLVLQHD